MTDFTIYPQGAENLKLSENILILQVKPTLWLVSFRK